MERVKNGLRIIYTIVYMDRHLKNSDDSILMNRHLKNSDDSILMNGYLNESDDSILMDRSNLEKLTKSQLIELLLKQEKKKPKVVIVDTKRTRVYRPQPLQEALKCISAPERLRDGYKPTSPPRTGKWANVKPKPVPRKSVKQMVKEYEDHIIQPPEQFRDGYKSIPKPTSPPRTGKWANVKPKPVPRKSVKQMVKEYEDHIIQPPEQFRDGYKSIPKPRTDRPLQLRIKPLKPTRAPPLPPNDGFNFDDDIFQTENTSLGKFKIISVQSMENKKFKSYTNEFKVKILKKLDDVKEVYYIFQELVKTVKKRRKLSNNDMLRLVIQNENLPKAISMKFNKVQDFKLGDLEDVINILEYRAIPIEKCKIIVQSVKMPTGKGRLYLTKDTISRKDCIITVKNDDTTCLARSIVTAYANLHPEKMVDNATEKWVQRF